MLNHGNKRQPVDFCTGSTHRGDKQPYDPAHPLYTYACRVERSKYLGPQELFWPSPERIAELITVLSKYTADPLHCIRVHARRIFNYDPEKLETKLITAKEAFPSVPDIKIIAAKNLLRSFAVIREKGTLYEQKRAAERAQKRE